MSCARRQSSIMWGLKERKLLGKERPRELPKKKHTVKNDLTQCWLESIEKKGSIKKFPRCHNRIVAAFFGAFGSF